MQLEPAATLPPALQVPPVTRKAALLEAMALMESEPVPVLDRVTACPALVLPTVVDAKVSEAGETDAAGVPRPTRPGLPR